MIDYESIGTAVANAQKIVVMQADNPDGDSLASSLALEQILSEMGKDVFMYCSIDMPNHLRHLEGWDRVMNIFASSYDLCILVDSASQSLLDNFTKTSSINLASKPLVIIDHHATEGTIDYATSSLVDETAVSTGQVILDCARANTWALDPTSCSYIASSILSDTLGLTTDALKNNPRVFTDMAFLVERGVDLAKLNAKRLEALKYSKDLVAYKGQLLQRVEFNHDGSIASIAIPHDEIKEHSMKFNPTIILDEMRMVEGVKVTLGFKQYLTNGVLSRVTVRIRCDRSAPVGLELAETFGGGGHTYASGIKFEGNLVFDDIKRQVISKAEELLEATDV